MRLHHAEKIDFDQPLPEAWQGQCIFLDGDLVSPIELGMFPENWLDSKPAAIVSRAVAPFTGRLLSQAGIHIATTTDSLAGLRDGAEITLDLGASVIRDEAGRKYVLISV